MPVYLLHGFRWPRPMIRIHIILQNLDDAAAEWLVAPETTDAMLSNFDQLYPDCMEHLQNLRFVEQYDPSDTSDNAASQPYAYVADVFEEVKLGVDVDEVKTRGVASDQWSAMMELRDKLAPEEKVAWYVVVCGDEERLVPSSPEDAASETDVGMADATTESSEAVKGGSMGNTEQRTFPPPEKAPPTYEPKGFRKLFGSARSGKRKTDASVRDVPTTRPGLSNSTSSSSVSVGKSSSASLSSTGGPIIHRVPPAMPAQPPPLVELDQLATDNVTDEVPIDLPPIAEAPDTSDAALRTLEQQRRLSAAAENTAHGRARHRKSSTSKADRRASWSNINYSTFYADASQGGLIHTRRSNTGLSKRDSPPPLPANAARVSRSSRHDSPLNGSIDGGSTRPSSSRALQHDPPHDPNIAAATYSSSVERPRSMKTNSYTGSSHYTHRSMSPVSEMTSGYTTPRRKRGSRAQSTISTISNQSVNPDDLIARNMDMMALKLGTV